MWREKLAHQKLMFSIAAKLGLRYKLDICINSMCNVIKPFLSKELYLTLKKSFRYFYPKVVQYPELQMEQCIPDVRNAYHSPECWSHRGASPNYPDNTVLSMAEIIVLGAEGIETDIHLTSDDELILFHDPDLGKTTNGTGLIRLQPWHGAIEHVRLSQHPTIAIPLFSDVCRILLRQENRQIKLHLDVKLTNDPSRLFTVLKQSLNVLSNQHSQTDMKSLLDRIQLGVWHTKFIQPAKELLPHLTLVHIGVSPLIARKYFWDDCQGFSMRASAMRTQEGRNFLKECQFKQKFISIWTVNDDSEMRQVVQWGVDAILTDKLLNLKRIKQRYQSERSPRSTWRFPRFSLPEPLIFEVFNQCATLAYIEFAGKMTMQEGLPLKQFTN